MSACWDSFYASCICWSPSICYEITLALLLCYAPGSDAGIWSCVSSFATHATNSQEFCAFKQQLVHWVRTRVGMTIFLWPMTQGFGLWKPLSFLLADMLTDPDIPGAIWILLRSCVTSCRVATEVRLLRFFYYSLSLPFFCTHVVFWFSIWSNSLEPNSYPDADTK